MRVESEIVLSGHQIVKQVEHFHIQPRKYLFSLASEVVMLIFLIFTLLANKIMTERLASLPSILAGFSVFLLSVAGL